MIPDLQYIAELRRDADLYERSILANAPHPDPEYGKLLVAKLTADLQWTRDEIARTEAKK